MNRNVVIKRLYTKSKRKIVISDIHGNLDLYKRLLIKIDYKPNEDCLILLGDIIEKGPKNLETLHYASGTNTGCTLYYGKLRFYSEKCFIFVSP